MKGTDSSCLCINCEGKNAAKCGASKAIKLIDRVHGHNNDEDMDNVSKSANNSDKSGATYSCNSNE
eukprot:2203529-Ditylum_brightwellii.AAC.2